MSDVTIDKISIEVEAKAGSANKVLEQLEKNLTNVKRALTGFDTSGLERLQKTLEGIESKSKNISVTPKVDTSNISKAERQISNDLEKIRSKFDKLGPLANSAIGGDSSAITSFSRQAVSLQGDIDALQGKMRRLDDAFDKANIRFPTDEFKKLDAEIDASRNKLDELLAKEKEAANGAPISNEAYIKMQTDIANAQTQLDSLIAKQDEMKQKGTAFYDPFKEYREGLLAVQQSLNQTKDAVNSTKESMSEVPAPPTSPYRDVNNQIVKISANSKSAIASLVKLGRTSFEKLRGGLSSIKSSLSDIGDKFSNRASKGFMKLLKYGLGIRSIYVLFRRLRKAVIESFGELQKSGAFFQTTKSNVDALKTSLATLKFQFGAAFEPIFNAVAPALEAFINYLIKAMNVISALFAKLTGKDTYSKVAAVTLATKNNTAGAAKAAKDLVKQLQHFDELNNLTSNNSGGGGGGGGGGADSDSATYVEESVENAFKNLPEEIGKIWDVFKKAWENKGKGVVKAATRAFKNIKQVVSDVGKTIYQVFTDGTGQIWVESILTLFTSVSNILGDIALAFDQAWTDDKNGYKLVTSFLTMLTDINNMLSSIGESWRKAWNKGNGKDILSNILKIITNINTTVSNLAKNFTSAWEKNKVGERIWNNILGTIKDVTGFIEDITAATKDWSASLDFYPLLESIEKITRSIRKFTKSILKIVKSLYEDYILPIAKKLTESTIPDLLETASGLLDEISKTLDEVDFKTIFKYLKKITELGLDDLMTELKNLVADIELSLSFIQTELKDIKAFCEWFSKTSLGKTLKEIWGYLEPLRGTLSSIAGTKVNFSSIFQNVTGPIKKIQSIIDLIKLLIDSIKATDWKELGKSITSGLRKGLTSKSKNKFKKAIKKVKDYIVEAIKIVFGIHSPAKEMEPYGEDILDGIIQGFVNAFGNIDKAIQKLKNKIVEKIKQYFNNFNPWDTISNTWENAKTFVLTIKAKIDEKSEKIFDDFKAKWESLKDKTVTLITNLKEAAEEKVSEFKENWNGIKEKIEAKLESTITEVGGQTLEDFKANWNALTNGDSKEVKATLSADTSQSFKDTAKAVQTLITDWTTVMGLKDANLKANITGSPVKKIGNIKTAFNKLKKLKAAKLKVAVNDKTATKKLENVYDKWEYLVDNASVTLKVSFQDSFTESFKAAWNGVRASVATAISTINNSFKKNIPIPPKMATGGIVSGATPIIAGEAGTEAIVPLERNLGWLKYMSNMILDGVVEQSKYRYSATPNMFNMGESSVNRFNGGMIGNGNGADSELLSEQNRLLAEQNRLLSQIASKDVTISSRDIFRATQKEARDYSNRTGASPFLI